MKKKDVMGKESFLCQHFLMDFTLYNSYSVTAWRKCMRVIFSHLVISVFKIWFQVMVFLLQQNFCKVHSFVNIMVSFYKTYKGKKEEVTMKKRMETLRISLNTMGRSLGRKGFHFNFSSVWKAYVYKYLQEHLIHKLWFDIHTCVKYLFELQPFLLCKMIQLFC